MSETTMQVEIEGGLRDDDATRVHYAVSEASGRWANAFNTGNAAAAAAQYEPDALMVAKPFGEFRGRADIEAFWENLIQQGFSDVEYINPTLTVLDAHSARIQSAWRMNNAKGVITNELWILQADGSALLREDHFEVTE